MPWATIGIGYTRMCIWFLLVCLTFFGTQCLAAHAIRSAVLAGTGATLLLSLATGANVLTLQRSENKLCALYCLVAGSVLASGILMILTLTTANFALSAASLCVVNVLVLLRQWRSWLQLRLSKEAFMASLIALVATICWSQENLGCLAIKAAVVINRPWQDIFFHTSNITLLAQAHGAHSLHSTFVRDSPLSPYHYAGYMLASLILFIAHSPAISVASGFFVPFGFFLTICAAYCFAAALFKKSAGLFASTAVSLVPDPASLHLVSSFCGYYFFQEGGGVNGSWGVACFALAWLSLFSAFRANRGKNLTFAACFFSLLTVFKIQIFLVYSGLFCSFFLVCLFQKLKTRIVALASFWLAYFSIVRVSQNVPGFPTLRFSTQGSVIMVPILGSFSCCNQLVHLADVNPHYIHKALIGIPIYTLATYGLWLPLGLLAIVLGLKSSRTRIFSIFLILTVLNNWVVSFALAPNKGFGDFFEIIHKTFVWPVFIMAVCSTCLIYTWISTKKYTFLRTRYMQGITVLVLCLLIINSAYAGKSLLRSLSGGTGIKFPKGLYSCANFLRTRSSPGSTVQFCGNDDYQFLMTCSERFPFVSELIVNPTPPNATVKTEINQLSKLPTRPFKEARLLAEKWRINWLVVNRKSVHGEPFQGAEKLVFWSGAYQVYKTGI